MIDGISLGKVFYFLKKNHYIAELLFWKQFANNI